MIKPVAISLILSLVVSNGWHIKQLDVSNAFLHGSLDEAVYMSQPKGFVNSQYPDHVCKLRKTIYGLKQAPRQWFKCLSTTLFSLGFKGSKTDSSLFFYTHGSIQAYCLAYVDDIILTGNNTQFLSSVLQLLQQLFLVKDLGRLNFFLGIEAN